MILPMKIALITGASSGLGAAMAKLLGQQGNYQLILTGRNTERLQQVCQEIGSSSKAVSCDLSSSADMTPLVRAVGNQPIDVLINNAGVFSRASFENTSDEEWDRQWQINMMGPVRLTRTFFPQLQQATSPTVINIASSAALRPVPNLSAYSSIKAAMVMWTQSLAQEWASHGIRVNCICPGIVNTPIHSFYGLPENQLQEVHKLHPLGRIGSPQEVAEMTQYLINAQWVTGSIMTIDGGISIA